MSLSPSACTPSVSNLVDCLLAAVQTGISDREAASISRQASESHRMSKERLEAETPLRISAVIGAIPQKVLHTVSTSMTWDTVVTVAVMELESHEYPGPFLRSPHNEPEAKLSSSKLAYGGKGVWDYLSQAGMKPKLKYVMDDNIRRYKLAIVIDVLCLPPNNQIHYIKQRFDGQSSNLGQAIAA